MANGLRVWDSSGNIMMDTTNKIGKVLGVYSVTFTGAHLTETGTITNSGFSNGTPFCILGRNPVIDGTGDDPCVADFNYSVSGNTLTWNVLNEFGTGAVYGPMTLIYGFY